MPSSICAEKSPCVASSVVPDLPPELDEQTGFQLPTSRLCREPKFFDRPINSIAIFYGDQRFI